MQTTIPASITHIKRMESPEYRKAYAEHDTVIGILFKMIVTRRAANVSLEQLATKMNVSRKHLHRLETGQVAIRLNDLHRYFWELGFNVRIGLEPADS